MNEEQIRERLLLDEYEIQHFGFSSSYFITELKDAINYTNNSIHEQMGKSIARNLGLSDEEKKVLDADITTLTNTCAKITEKCIKKNEKCIRDFFSIPRYILLSTDKIYEETASIDEQELLNEIKQLEVQYLKEKSLSFLYDEEIKHIDRTSELQNQVSKLLKQIDKIPDSNSNVTKFNKIFNLYNDLLERCDNEFNTNMTRERYLVSQ